MDKLKDGEQPGYVTARSAMNDGRVGMIPYERLENELVRLQKDNTTGKVDHPIDGCFTADTKIALVDGRNLTIAELLLEQEYKTNYVYTINETTHMIEPKPIKKVFQTKLVKELVKVTLDNDEVIYCTPEHKFMLSDCSFKEAYKLNSNDYLASNEDYSICAISVEYIKYDKFIFPVYDLEIEDNHNFALTAGVFVHNSKDLSDSFAGAIYNASTYEENPTFNLELVDAFEEVNFDEDDMIKEQAKLAQQLLMQNRNKQQRELPKSVGLLDTPLPTGNNVNNAIHKYSDDDFIIF